GGPRAPRGNSCTGGPRSPVDASPRRSPTPQPARPGGCRGARSRTPAPAPSRSDPPPSLASRLMARAWQFSEEPPGVDDRIRRFRLLDEVDTFVIRSQRMLVVVDTMSTPADARQLRTELEPDLDGRTLLVVDTHADYDHAWGNQVFADV